MFHYGGRRQPPGSRGTPNMGGGKFTQPPRPRLPPPGMDKIQPNLAMGVYGQIAAPPHPQYHRGVNNRMPLSWSTPPPQPQRRSVLDILRLEETNLRNEIRTIDSNILDLETGLQNFAWTLGVDACPSFLDTSTIASMKSILRGGFESTHCRFVPRVPLQRMHGKRVGPTVNSLRFPSLQRYFTISATPLPRGKRHRIQQTPIETYPSGGPSNRTSPSIAEEGSLISPVPLNDNYVSMAGPNKRPRIS
eukprot:GHVO01011739.1.p1 GENE.GHVO01011739.1~~GHVO01011739.1.p1  ORF type:complete len:248 (+),score=52.88 GHVO01011739.1:80-823(+)